MTSSPRDAIATTPGAFFCSTASRSTKSIEFPGFVPLPAASVRITIPASAAAASKPRRTAPRTAFILFLPALQLTALDCVLHGLISNESEFRLAVPNILKKHYVVHALDGLMFCSLRLNPVSLRVGKVHRRNDLLVRNNLMVFTTIPALLPIRCSHAKQKFPSHAKIYLANGRSKALRSPPLHHVLRVCPRLPN